MRNESDLISIFLPVLVGGGAERVMLNMANEMARMGENIDFVVAKAEGPYLQQVSEQINLVDLHAGRTAKSLLPLAKYLKNEKPAVLISGLDHVNVIAVLAKKIAGTRTRNIITLHNTFSVKMQNKGFFSRAGVIRLLLRHYYPAADEIVAVSEGVAADYVNVTGLPRTRIKVIYNPVINDELLRKARERIEHPWFADKAEPIILSVGRLSEQKNYAALIRAVAMVREKIPVRLMILGEGELRESLETLRQNLNLTDHVLLPGFVGNPYKYMAQADLFVLSSKWEGLPTVLIEALAVGTPVVSTNCRSGPDEILEGGKLGRLVPVDDVDALACAIIESLEGGEFKTSTDQLDRYRFATAAKEYLDVIGK